MKKQYALTRLRSLLGTKAAVAGPDGIRLIRLLVDTGSSYTILPVDLLEAIGCPPANSAERVRIITGSGYLILPRLKVTWFDCLGRRTRGFKVAAHTLPMGSFFDGLFGMDFLSEANAILHVKKGSIEVG
jgi:aspartyl protease family protein